MRNRNNFVFFVVLAILFISISGCTSISGTDMDKTPEITVAVTEVATRVPSLTPSPTSTATVTPTSTPSATPTLVPTETPSPTATPISPEFANLVLALDYDRTSFEPLSPQDYFPLGVTYLAVVFDYIVPGSTKLDWQIYRSDEAIESSGVISLSRGDGRKALVIRPEGGLDEGEYDLRLRLDGETVLSKEFEVFWNPTIWPITLGTNISANGEVVDTGTIFPLGTEFLFASYPTINFSVGDELVAEWSVDGEKLGEHRYVWNNPDWSTGVHANKIDNQIDNSKPLPAGNYEIIIYVNDLPKQCKAFQVTGTPTEEVVQGCESFKASPAVAESTSPDSWNRYQSRTLSELDLLTGELLAEITGETAVYLETSPEYQYPSRVKVVFTGDFRDTSEFRLEWIRTWMATFAPSLSADDINSLFGQEGLFIEGAKEYWLPVQNTLIPIMEDELSPGNDVELLVIWIGATIDSGEIDRIYLVNAFE